MANRDEYCATTESQSKALDEQVDNLNASKQVGADVRAAYDTQLEAMRAERDLAYAKLRELRTANESAWQLMQFGIMRPGLR